MAHIFDYSRLDQTIAEKHAEIEKMNIWKERKANKLAALAFKIGEILGTDQFTVSNVYSATPMRKEDHYTVNDVMILTITYAVKKVPLNEKLFAKKLDDKFNELKEMGFHTDIHYSKWSPTSNMRWKDNVVSFQAQLSGF